MKLLIVDDEAPILEYIAFCAQRADASCEIAACVTSGQLAMRELEKQQVDVVLTDITMPGMNGIELLTNIRSAWPDTDVVILTCHDDFSFARSAMQQGVTEYILKDEISEEMMRALMQRIREKRASSLPKNVIANWMSFAKALEDAVRNTEVDLLDEAFLAEQFTDKKLGNYFVCLFENNDAVIDTIAAYHSPAVNRIYFFPYETHYVLTIVDLIKEPAASVLAAHKTAFEMHMADKAIKPLGASEIFYDVRSLKRAVLSAYEGVTRSFYGAGQGKAGEVSAPVQAEALNGYRNKAIAAIYDKDIDAFKEYIDKLVDCAKQSRTPPAVFRQVACFIVESTETAQSLKENLLEQATKANTVQEIQIIFARLMVELESTSAKYSKNIEDAIRYVKAHYSESIALQDVAKAVFLNPEYFSRRFKKEVGINFSEYLLDLRMHKAKYLLITTADRISDIAESVGMPNVSYFTAVYKKYFGQTPAESRK